MAKITKGKPITIRASRNYNARGNDGEYLDVESFLKNSAMDGVTQKITSLNYNKQSGQGTEYELPSPNTLNKFATYNYLFTLSALSSSDLENPEDILTNSPHDVIARSGGIGDKESFTAFKTSTPDSIRNIDGKITTRKFSESETEGLLDGLRQSDNVLRRGHDIFFERVIIDSTNRPNEQRKLMNYNKIEIELVEPHGITLFEKLKAASWNNGFQDHIDAPYLLTLEFKGTDELGREISIPDSKRVMPIKITNAPMTFNNGVTSYNLTAVPWTEFAMTDRFLYTRSTYTIVDKIKNFFSAAHPTLQSALDHLANQLTVAQDDEIEKQLRATRDAYVIKIDPRVANPEDGTPLKNQGSSNYNINQTGGFKATVRPGMSIAKIITDLVKQADYYKNITDLVLRKWKTTTNVDTGDTADTDFMVPWFKVITNVRTLNNQLDSITKMHPKIIEFHVVPFKVHVMNFVIPGMSLPLAKFARVKKVYDYVFTGNNTEVLDLSIDYKYGYFQARLSNNLPGVAQDKMNLSIGDKFARLVAQSNTPYPDGLLPLRSYPSIQSSAKGYQRDLDGSPVLDEYFEYLTNPRGDMVNVNLKIMGDPAWCGQDHFLPVKRSGLDSYEMVGSLGNYAWDEKRQCFNFDQAEALMNLNFRFPTDINEIKGVMDFSNLENIQFTGLYKVPRVVSTFEKGQFTQELTCVRLNNQGMEIKVPTKAELTEDKKTNKNTIDYAPIDLPKDGGNYGEGAA